MGEPEKINDLELKSLFFIQNNSYSDRDISIGGTRGWIARDSELFDKDRDEKVFRREVLRLENSLKTLNKDAKVKIAMVHYPPFNVDKTPNDLVRVMKEFNIDLCIYGHLHAEGHRYVIEGSIEGIDIQCVSSDYIKFDPKLLVKE